MDKSLPDQKIILHIDFDSFFASVEQQYNFSLRGKPIGVLAANSRSCIIASSREAKRLGIKTGARSFEAKQICPSIALVPADFIKYFEISKKFLNICKQVIKEFSVLTEEHYAKVRTEVYPYGAAPLWQTGLRNYFENNADLVRLELNGNHKVIKIESLDYTEDVYDLTIDKTHNFALATGVFVHNSIDGDSPAAMRYTECRLSAIADEMLRDIDKNTVNFIDNYSGTTQEPTVLPSVIPNLLLNGAAGIAVGMATQIPPHNLGEVTDALIYMIEHPLSAEKSAQHTQTPTEAKDDIQFESSATVEELMKFIKEHPKILRKGMKLWLKWKR